MPAFGSPGPSVAPQIFRFFSSCVYRCISRIDTKIDDLKITSDAPSQFLQRLDQTVVDHRTEHRAAIVPGHKNSRSFYSRIPETELLIIFVAENQIARELQARMLFHPQTTEIAGSKAEGRTYEAKNPNHRHPERKNSLPAVAGETPRRYRL